MTKGRWEKVEKGGREKGVENKRKEAQKINDVIASDFGQSDEID